MQGGRGGDALDLADGGRGGDALGIISGLVMNGLSLEDTVSGVTKGGAGGGAPIQTSYADGYYLIGNKTFTTRFTVDNATLSSIGSYEFYVDNYTEAIAVNTPFTKLAVMAAGNLTVRNYLEVDALWPNGFTPVGGAQITVMDGSSRIWDRQAPSGVQPWILVTDRIYIDSPIPTDNVTQVSVTYPPYSFASDPRSVNMGTSHTESFVMVDKDAPTSAAGALPTYENVLTFWVWYTASDGNGTGVGNITLWYRTGGSAVWVQYAVQPAGNFGQFTFTASSNGVYEFATTADDLAGNKEVRPSANDTWTTVDTIRPGSHANGLSQYQNRSTFTVSWGPDVGVTDIVSYTLQYNAGAAWTNWLVDTTTTTGTFSAGGQGIYAFRAIAKDAAGNVEVPPATNDTWTMVDTIAPASHTLPLPRYEASLGFTVYWGPQFDSLDIASYRIQSRDNGGVWTDSGTFPVGTTSAVFTGQDGHTYEFRSMATDRAGNAEPIPPGNDTWTIVDVLPPSITDSRPVGANTNLTPRIVITFSEPMNRASVEQAFSITPAIDGSFVWSSDFRTVSFVPTRELQSGATYAVVIDSSARDLAGNTMVGSKT